MADFLRPYRLRLTVFLLSSFLLAIGWSVLCNLFPLESTSTTHHVTAKHSHGHHEDSYGHEHGHAHDDEVQDHQHGENEKSCCESMSAQLFSGLAKHKPATYTFAQNYFLSNLFVSGELFIPYHTKIKVAVILSSLPLPNLPDIRVFIQSFLN